jgi:3-oxoacyl-[acyl-carrier-protein] synthase II
LAAAFEAVADAALTPGLFEGKRSVPLVLGVGSSAVEVIASSMAHLLKRGPRHMHVHSALACHPHQAASILAQYLPYISQGTTTGSACTAGMDSINDAAGFIRTGKAEAALCGGTDAPINALTYAAMAASGLLSVRNDAPGKACRPFDLDRDSGIVSDGAAILILENLDHALARGRRPYLEVTGFATHVDTHPEEPGTGWEFTMREALANAGRRPDSVDYLCAHAPGHPLIDRIETAMIKKVFGAYAYRLPISSIKGVIGSPLSAAGPMQVIACALALQEGVIPSTLNLEKPDPACDLNYLPGPPRRLQPDVILINTHGLGGGNSSLVVERWRP